MKKSLLLILLLLAATVGGAWFVMHSGDEGATGTSTQRAQSRAGAADPGIESAAPGSRRRSGATPGPDADRAAVAGTVSDHEGRPLEGALVTLHFVPAGEVSDTLRAVRGIVGDAMTPEEIARAFGDLEAQDDEAQNAQNTNGRSRRELNMNFGMNFGMGGGGGSARARITRPGDPAEDPDEQMRRGTKMMRKLMSDPSTVGRFTRAMGSMAAGFEEDGAWPVADEVRTAADGRFRFDSLPEGRRVELRVTAASKGRVKLRAKPGNVSVGIKLWPAVTLTGEVRSEGRPLAGAEVRLRTKTVRTGADGKFSFDGAQPPREPVLASAPGHSTAGVYVTVAEKTAPAPIVIDLFPAGRITGRAQDRLGAPVRGATVDVIRGEGLAGLMMFAPQMAGQSLSAPPASATTGPDGRFAIDGLPGGTVKLRVTCLGYLDGTADGIGVAPLQTTDDVNVTLLRESVLVGRVTDLSGAPVAGASVDVSVSGEGPAQMMLQMFGGAVRSGTTGADGAYRVGAIPEGARNVTVEAEGLMRAVEKVEFAAESEVRRDFSLRPGVVLRGSVVSPDGSPVSGARVRVRGPAAEGAPANPMAAFLPRPVAGSAQSGADGRFEVAGLPEGLLDVSASAPEFLEGTANGALAGTDVTVRLGAAATIRGIVVSEATGAPVAGAAVFRKNAGRGGANPMAQFMQRDDQVLADQSGRFTMPTLEPGTYTIYARSRGFADSDKIKVEAVVVGPGAETKLALPPGASLSGRVVRRGAGTPVEGALVWVDQAGRTGFDPAAFADLLGQDPKAPESAVSAKTAADGTFTLDGLTPGKSTVEIRAKGFASSSIANVPVPGAAFTGEVGEGGVVEGFVFSKSGWPLEGASVMLQRGAMGQGMSGMGVSDRTGKFRIERVPAGSYQAILMDPENPMGFGGMKAARVKDAETTLVEFGKKGVGRTLSGFVERDGKPLASATVSLMGGSSGFTIATSDAAGRFRFEGVEPGAYTVTVQTSMMGGGNQSAKVTVAAESDPEPVRLELSALSVTGVVIDGETNAPVRLAQVVLLSRDVGSGGGTFADLMQRQRGQTFTGDTGRFELESVPAGTFDLRVTAGGYAEAEIEGVQAGGAPVRVVLTKGLELTVTVTGGDGKPVAGAMVVPENAGGREGTAFDITNSRQTDVSGTAKLRLLPGRYTLRVRADARPEATAVVDAGQGTAAVRVDDGGALEIVVKTSAGAAIPGATVKILDAEGREIPRTASMSNLFGGGDTTDASGRAVRDGLRIGRVTVVVSTPGGGEARASAVIVSGETARADVTADR